VGERVLQDRGTGDLDQGLGKVAGERPKPTTGPGGQDDGSVGHDAPEYEWGARRSTTCASFVTLPEAARNEKL